MMQQLWGPSCALQTILSQQPPKILRSTQETAPQSSLTVRHAGNHAMVVTTAASAAHFHKQSSFSSSNAYMQDEAELFPAAVAVLKQAATDVKPANEIVLGLLPPSFPAHTMCCL